MPLLLIALLAAAATPLANADGTDWIGMGTFVGTIFTGLGVLIGAIATAWLQIQNAKSIRDAAARADANAKEAKEAAERKANADAAFAAAAARHAEEVKVALDKTTKATTVQLAAAAAKAEEVKTALVETTADTADKLDGLAKVAGATHTLVNSQMSVQLAVTAAALRSLANVTKRYNLPSAEADAKAAAAAEGAHAEHEAKQAVVDAGKKVETP